MFEKGTIISLICFLWFIIHDRKERRRNALPDITDSHPKDDEKVTQTSSNEEVDRLIQSWKEECRKTEELLKQYSKISYSHSKDDEEITQTASKEEVDRLIQSWKEECRKAEELLKRHPVSDD